MCWEACASACFTLQLQPLLTIQEHKDVMPGFFPFFSRFSFHCPQKGTLTVEIIATQISNNSIKICQCANIQIYSQGKAAALRAQVNGCALLHVREATRLLWHLQGSNKFWFLKQTLTNNPFWVKLADVKPNSILLIPAECQQETDCILDRSQDTIFSCLFNFRKIMYFP